MKQRELEMQELSRILDLRQRLELLQQWLTMGLKRTRARRQDAWGTIAREANLQLVALSESVPDVRPAVLPSMSEQRSMGVEPAGE